MLQDGGLFAQARGPVGPDLRDLLEDPRRGLLARPRYRALNHAVQALGYLSRVALRLHPQVVAVQNVHLERRFQAGLVGHQRLFDTAADGLGGIAGVAAPDDRAGDQAFDVPLRRRHSGLVKIVQVEHYCAVRGCVHAEIRHVSVTAAHEFDPARWACGEVGGHDRGGAAVEREGVGEHSGETQRYEFAQPVGVLLDKNFGGGSMRRSQLRQGAPWSGLSQRPAARYVLGRDFKIDQAFTQHPLRHSISICSAVPFST